MGNMRRYPETVIFAHGPAAFPKPSLASLPSSAGQLQRCLVTSASALTLAVNVFLTCMLFYRKSQDTAAESKPSADTTNDVQMEPSTAPTDPPATAAAPATRKRPRLDLTSEPRERKRGKTMFGLLVGTLNKARTEDKQRSATDAVRSSLSLSPFSTIWIAH